MAGAFPGGTADNEISVRKRNIGDECNDYSVFSQWAPS